MIANILSEQWLNPSSYNFWSSEWGGLLVKVLAAILIYVVWRQVRKHFECDVEAPTNCQNWGHVVPGTGHRACHEHHPRAESRGAVTVQDIARHHDDARRAPSE